MATKPSNFTVNLADLSTILSNILIAENHVATGILTNLDGTPIDPLLSVGLRTVDGSFNNLLNPKLGAADQVLPRLLTPEFLNEADGDVMPLGPPGSGAPTITNNNYNTHTSVADADPRIISNLISDQTLGNVAAVNKALVLAGSTNLSADLASIMNAYANAKDAVADLKVKQGIATVAAQELLTAQNAVAPLQTTANTTAGIAAADATARNTELSDYTTQVALVDPVVNPEVALLTAKYDAFVAFGAGSTQYVAAVAAYDAAGVLTGSATDLVNTEFNQYVSAFATATLSAGVAASAAAVLQVALNLVITETTENAAALAAVTTAEGVVNTTATTLGTTATNLGLEVINDTVTIANLSPDIGLSPSFNGWMTMFGQFFDHGLDLIPKGGNGTVYIPLQPDDPLYVPGGPNFMALTRAATVTTAGADGIMGTADDQTHETINTTTPYIDQNQTYTSNASHQVFLREYKMVGGEPASTGRLLDGANGGIGNWAEVKAQALNMLGIQLNDFDVGNVPLLRTDPYGRFIPDPVTGFAQIIIGVGADGIANTADDIVRTGSPTVPATTTGALRTGHAFLDDIAHHAAPGKWDHDGNPATPKINQTADVDVDINGDGIIDTAEMTRDDGLAGTYDNEMLDRHFITGDGRGNENIGLTAVHTIFHAEHNRLVEDYKVTILGSNDLAVINEWLLTDLTNVTQIPTTAIGIAALNWDGERLFQAGRFVTEMQYQHLVFEEFARKVQPAVDAFGGISSTIDPSIVAEFAHVVYRFGHSMLTETVDRLNAANQIVDGDPNVAGAQQIGLIEAFLNPVVFDQNATITAAQAAGQIVRGMTRQVGNEIDEFITEALRNNLVGLPLDLGALNIARGRDTGVPSFNHARAQFFAATGDARLTPYTGWADFATHMKNPLSVINFIAAYGTHSTILAATTLDAKRDAAMLLVLGGVGAPADRLDYLNGTGAWAGVETGLNAVDFWIGGLAEAKQEFGGMLGATFNFVFENQMERLQAGDRFYYLERLGGMNLLSQMETNSFANIVMRNTDLGETGQGHLPGLVFNTPDYILEIVQAVQIGADPTNSNPIVPLFIRRDVDGDGNSDLLQFNGGAHVVLGGSEENDTLIGGLGIDTLWGDGGNDRLDGGYEADIVHGGNGDDIITNLGGDDFLFGEEGNDVIGTGSGIVVAAGGRGNDFIFTGQDAGDVFSGEGNDFILGNIGDDALAGNEGNDWIEGGEGADGINGDNGGVAVGGPPIIGHDVLNGQGGNTNYSADAGDDIMVLGPGVQRSNGFTGFDWAIHKGDIIAANTDLGAPLIPAIGPAALIDRFRSVEALSGWTKNDILTGANVLNLAGGLVAGDSNLLSQNVSLINGLAELLGLTPAAVAALPVNTSIINTTLGAEVIIGGGGNDTITGNLGNDILDGDAWLNVRIAVAGVPGTTSVDSLASIRARLLSGEINPGQLSIVREILQSTTAATDIDTVVFNGNRADYTATLNANGTITVAHTNVLAGVPNDGTDTVRNFENYKFADGTINQAQLLNIAPVITSNGGAATAAINVAENSTTVTTVTATDANLGSVLTYALSAVVAANNADAALFTIDPNTGALTFVGAPNFEVLGDAGANGVYNVVVQVSDGISIDTQAIAITVTNVNETPTITSNGGADLATSINENSTVVTTVTATDPDAGAVLTYSVVGGADAAKFVINQTTGVLSFVTAPDFEIPSDVGGDNIYDVIVQASDAGGLTDTQAIAVTVNDVVELVNIAPTGALNISSYTRNATSTNASITATNTLNDANGMTGFVPFQWQQLIAGVWTDIAGANAATLANRSNATVRVTSSYSDTFGLNSFVSAQTAIIGTTAASTIAGLAGNDLMLGLAGNDVLTASAGNDTIDGGIGNDTYSLSATTADAIVNLTTNTSSSAQTGLDTLIGIETVIGGAGNDSMTDGAGVSRLDGGNGNDTFVMTNDNAADVLRGGNGVDSIDYSAFVADLIVNLGGTNNVLGSGTAGNLDNINNIQNIISGAGNDSILGDNLVNAINGGGGNDSINGSGGADRLTGGTGADTFVYTAAGNSGVGAGRDVIADFISGVDKLDFSAIDANTATALPANEAFTFIGTGAFTAAAQVRYQLIDTDANGSLDSTLVRGNVNAGLGADFEILLQGVTTAILATDIILQCF